MISKITNTYQLKFHDDFYNPIMSAVKVSTIRDEPKPINNGDTIKALFNPSGRTRTIKIYWHYAIKFKDINEDIAKEEGYLHKDLLKHELKNIYPDITDEDYIYIYKFTDNIRL